MSSFKSHRDEIRHEFIHSFLEQVQKVKSELDVLVSITESHLGKCMEDDSTSRFPDRRKSKGDRRKDVIL